MNWEKKRSNNPAQNCHFEICQLIIENPVTNIKSTPLHIAAQMGHLKVCNVIIENVVDKNPAMIEDIGKINGNKTVTI